MSRSSSTARSRWPSCWRRRAEPDAFDGGTVRFEEIDLDVRRRAHERYDSVADDFTSVRGESQWTMEFSRGDRNARTVTRTVLSRTEKEFVLDATLDGHEGGFRVFSRTWNETLPRDRV